MSLVVGTVSSFLRKKYDVFYWEIREFSKLPEQADYKCNSPDFYFKGHKSYLTCYPNGTSSQAAKYLTIYFYSSDYDAPDCVLLTLGIKTCNGSIEKWLSRNIIYPEVHGIGSAALIRQTELLKRKAELVPSDCLTFVLFLSKAAPEIIPDVADRTETGHAEENDDDEEKSGKQGSEKVLEDVAKLLTSGDRSDATIVVGEAEFKVHSCILAARTPVFAALFEHETLEKATQKITITDCEPAVFKEFLNHLYTGSVQDLTAENSLGLYRVADKYLVRDLKEVCRDYMRDNLCLETFCDVVQLALKHEDEDLLESAFNYFATNFRLIIRSVEWQRYVTENPIEGHEIMIKSFGPP